MKILMEGIYYCGPDNNNVYTGTKYNSNIFYINCVRTNLGIIRSDCNVIYDLTCHNIAMVIYLLNELPDENSIKVTTRKCYSNNIDVAFINMNFLKNSILCPVKLSIQQVPSVKQKI